MVRQWWLRWLELTRRWLGRSLVGVIGSSLLVACGLLVSNNTHQPSTVELTLSAFVVTKAAYRQIMPQFAAKWQQEHQQKVLFNESYGPSGSQTRAVIDGLPADIVHLSLALDTQRIEQAKLIQPGWQDEVPNQGIVTKSVAALVVRQGNPQNIQTWADLAKPGISLITADPQTSGVARWNFLALWNSVIQTGGTEAAALDFVTKVYQNTPALARDAREATDVFFKQGRADVLINYENEVILAQLRGNTLAYQVPGVNISIDNPIAVVDGNVDKHGVRAVAEAFVQYLFTPEAQREFAKVGFRSVLPEVAQEPDFVSQYPAIPHLATVADYGGWDQVQDKFFTDKGLFEQIRAKLRK